MSGVPLTTNPPYGYGKDPVNPNKCIVDKPDDQIVRKIFSLCVNDFGPMQSAKRLKAALTEKWKPISPPKPTKRNGCSVSSKK